MMVCRRRIARTKCSITWFAFLLLLYYGQPFCCVRDTLTLETPIRDDAKSETLVSAGGKFELGFFTPSPTGGGRSGNGRYVGIWYHQLTPRTVVWVSNRDKPVPANSTGVIAIKGGNLHVLDATTGEYYWSAEFGPSSSAPNSTVKLMDSGNLVLSDGNGRLAGNNILWESFESPTDTFIPGMIMDKRVKLTSWRGEYDPGIGNFTFKLVEAGDNQNQYMITKSNAIPYWKSQEPAIGTLFRSDGMPPTVAYLLLNFSQSYLKKKTSSTIFANTSRNDSFYNPMLPKEYNYTRLVIDFTGHIVFWMWLENEWSAKWSEPKDQCSVFNACGNFGSCNTNNGQSMCKCLPGFEPQSLDKWKSGDFSNGCTRVSQLCSKKETFFTLKMMKVGNPDIQNDVSNETECKNNCILNNCYCNAYSYVEAGKTKGSYNSPSMCQIWGNLDYLQEEYANGLELSVRVALADLESTERDCEPCGTTMIPYPLSIRPGCGDPVYFRFMCNASTGPVSFMGPRGTGTYRVISIDPRAKKFLITVPNCDPRNRGKYQELLNQPPFRVIKWCKDSSNGSPVTEMGWDPPLEPTCNTSADCRGWPHSTCNPAKDGKKRCHCNAKFRWNDSNLNCTQEGGFQVEPFKPPREEHSRRQMQLSLIVVAVLVSIIFMACIISIYIWRRKMTSKRDKINRGQFDSERRIKELIDTSEFKEEEGLDVPFFDLQSILDATDNFSDANKLGQGGYGPVYKGKFLGGQELAIKRLSSVSRQGLQEFKNEVVLIAKLQHRNLVRLKGYCMKGEEKILLYEYMPNKSLDSFIFDRTQRMFLNWEMRFNIILGIARGLLYLHQDSRLRIIHRDLKTSNILLDEEMNPKISDFGLARIVGGKETESNTNTVVGTYGYMSPEYALDGTFSVKSDVFSFGVVVLEIISGKKNTGFYQSKQTFSLINHAWRLWTENKVLDLMDTNLDESCNKSQFIKCVNVGLLCVQEDPVDRPGMSNVLTMLDNETAIPPTPKQPAFVLARGNSSGTASSSTKPETISEITTAQVEGR